MTVNEFENVTTEKLREMLASLEKEAEEIEFECMERAQEEFDEGLTIYPTDPACDYISDGLRSRARDIIAEIRNRGEEVRLDEQQ